MASELTVEEAFEALGISQTSNADEIRSAFRELSKHRHPDVPEGSHDQQAKLNRAYETALAYSNGGQLVVIEMKKALQIVERNIARQEASQEILTFAAITANHRTRPLQRVKYLALILAGIAGFLGFITDLPGTPPDLIQLMKEGAVLFAGVGGILQYFIQYQNQLIDEFKESISEEENCVVKLRILGVTANQTFTLDDILERMGVLRNDGHDLVARHIIRVTRDVFRLRPSEMAKMAVLKGVENGILEINSKHPKTYLVTPEFKSEFR